MKNWKKGLVIGMLIASITIALKINSQINFCRSYSGDCLPVSEFTVILLKDFWWLWVLIIMAPSLIGFLTDKLKVKINLN